MLAGLGSTELSWAVDVMLTILLVDAAAGTAVVIAATLLRFLLGKTITLQWHGVMRVKERLLRLF